MRSLWLTLSFLALVECRSPAILWPADQFPLKDGQSALETMSMEDFQKMFQDKKVIIFQKRSFTIESVAYPSKPLHYLQTVDAIALQGIKSVHRMLASLTASDSLKIVQLDDDGDLAGQDQQIKDTMEASPGFAAILIGSGTGAHRSRRQAGDDPKPTSACEKRGPTENCVAYVASVKKIDEKGTQDGKCSVVCSEEGQLSIIVKDNTEAEAATVKVVAVDDGYELVEENFMFRFDVDSTWAPNKFSFSCANLKLIPTTNNTKKDVYVLSGLQVWPKKGQEGFGDSFDCSTWFTAELWMGVVITLFYLAILFVAILFLLDVKTNDRFDDPKGKTITVNVSD